MHFLVDAVKVLSPASDVSLKPHLLKTLSEDVDSLFYDGFSFRQLFAHSPANFIIRLRIKHFESQVFEFTLQLIYP